jgi:ABC-type Zn uptake system ZnuABC Zn-binding protein ZnuA
MQSASSLGCSVACRCVLGFGAFPSRRWDAWMAPHKGLKVVTYHRLWTNFAERFGLDVVGSIEPKPGIPPSAAHTQALVEEMRRRDVRIILVEPYFDLKTPNAIARETGARVLVMIPSVGGVTEATDYLKLFDYNLNLLASSSPPRPPGSR